MSRRFIILRHGEAHDAGATTRDRDRELTTRGREQAEHAGRWLAGRGIRPDRVLASPAERTRETAKLAIEAAGGVVESVDIVDSLYLAEVEELVSVLGALASAGKTTLLVGHNPGLALLVLALAEDAPPALRQRGLATGTCVVVDVPDAGDLLGAGAFVAFETP